MKAGKASLGRTCVLSPIQPPDGCQETKHRNLRGPKVLSLSFRGITDTRMSFKCHLAGDVRTP